MIKQCHVRVVGRSADCACQNAWAQKHVAPSRTCVRTQANSAYHASQLLNLPGIKVFADVAVGGKRSLIVPHVSVKRIQQLNWAALASLGFKGCVLDKDNTLTKPFSMELEPGVQQSLAACKAAFNGNVVIFSNSAGLEGFDKDLSKARKVEAAVGVPVLQHKRKKPAGGCQELLAQFSCKPHEVIAVGDRLLTDIVFGNVNGMLTAHVQPFSVEEESVVVRAARLVEQRMLRRGLGRGVRAPENMLVSGLSQDTVHDHVTQPLSEA